MYLSQLKLWNFRKFGNPSQDIDLTKPDLTVEFNNRINLLVGENDSGKSAIIDAIKLVLRTHSLEWIRVEEDDFYQSCNRLRIECIFRDLKDNEARHFVEWLGMEKTDGKDDFEISTPYLRLILDVSKTTERILPYDLRGGASDEGRPVSAGAKDYLKSTYLKPLRDAKTELIARRNSRLSQILYGHDVFKSKDDHHLVKVLTEANEKIRVYFEDEANKETNGFIILETLKKYLSKFLKQDSPQNTNFHIDDPKLKNILEILKLTLYDERSGLGTYNLLFIAAELLHLNKKNYDGLRLAIIEEIEAHLHPQAQLRVMNALETESDQNNVQMIITTHSPNLASNVKLNSLTLCHGNALYPLGEDFTCLEKTDYNFLERFLDVTKANLFFAQGVVLVEGDSENLLIPSIARLAEKDLASHGISIVNVGAIAFLRYSRIFQRKSELDELKLPVAVITDLDIKPENEETDKDSNLEKKEKKYNGQSVKTFVSPHWTLEYCLALSPNFKTLLFDAIKNAGEDMAKDGYKGTKIDEDWNAFSAGLDQIDLAKKIYQLLTKDGKRISKPITAQYLAKALDDKSEDTEFVDSLKTDIYIDYILKAIDHATSNSNI